MWKQWRTSSSSSSILQLSVPFSQSDHLGWAISGLFSFFFSWHQTRYHLRFWILWCGASVFFILKAAWHHKGCPCSLSRSTSTLLISNLVFWGFSPHGPALTPLTFLFVLTTDTSTKCPTSIITAYIVYEAKTALLTPTEGNQWTHFKKAGYVGLELPSNIYHPGQMCTTTGHKGSGRHRISEPFVAFA